MTQIKPFDFYQLCAIGKVKRTGVPNKIYSIKIFPTKELAKKHKKAFIEEVTKPIYFDDTSYLDEKDLRIEIGGLSITNE